MKKYTYDRKKKEYYVAVQTKDYCTDYIILAYDKKEIVKSFMRSKSIVLSIIEL